MEQAQVSELLDGHYIRPHPNSQGYQTYILKSTFLKNHLLMACLTSYAGAFLDAKTMDGVDMYWALLEQYQGRTHDVNKVVNAMDRWEGMKFHPNTRESPEAFLSKINQCLKEMTIVNLVTGVRNMPISESLLPSTF